MTVKTYLKAFFWTAALLLGSVSAFNYTVNPLGIYGTPVIEGFNDEYPAASNYAHIHRAETIKQKKPEVLITGTSRALVGINPDPALFNGRRVFNAGLSNSVILEQRRALEFSHAVHPLDQVIITLDAFSFDTSRRDRGAGTEEYFNPKNLTPLRSLLYRYKTLPTISMLTVSIKHIRYIKRPGEYDLYYPNGYLHQYSLERHIEKHGVAGLFQPQHADIDIDTFQTDYPGRRGKTSYRHLEAMLEFCRQNGIDAILLISPVHERYLQRLEENGTDLHIRDWKNRIKDIVIANGLRYGEEPYPLWNFYGRNAITTEQVPSAEDTQARMRWFSDSDHYSPNTGDVILKKILGVYDPQNDPYPDFGKRIL